MAVVMSSDAQYEATILWCMSRLVELRYSVEEWIEPDSIEHRLKYLRNQHGAEPDKREWVVREALKLLVKSQDVDDLLEKVLR